MKQKLFYLLIGSCLATTTVAQFEISGEIRPRAEMRNGYKQLPDTASIPAFFISQRSRLAFLLKKEKYALKVSFQDVRVWGDELNFSATGVQGNDASIDLKEAWAEAYITPHITVRFGRQELKYGDQRMIATRNWNQHGMSYDAMRVSYENAFKLHLVLSYGNSSELVYHQAYDQVKIRTLNLLYFEKTYMDKLDVIGMYILSGMQDPEKPEGIYLKSTPGAALSYSFLGFQLSGSGYFQFGRNASGQNVSAYLLNANAKYDIGKLEFLAGIDYLSGHNQLSTDSAYLKADHTFDLLYGARHRYYGDMDYFSNMKKNTANGGLMDLYFQMSYAINDKLTLNVAYHNFNLQNNVIDPTVNGERPAVLNKHLANEADTKFTWKISKEIALDLGYSFLRSYDSLNKIQGISDDEAKNAHWCWLMITINPVLFTNR